MVRRLNQMSRQCCSKVEVIQLGLAHEKYGVWTRPKNHIQVQKENEILFLLAYVLHNSHKSQQNHVVVSQKLPRNVQKGVLQVQSSCFAYVLIADCVVWS